MYHHSLFLAFLFGSWKDYTKIGVPMDIPDSASKFIAFKTPLKKVGDLHSRKSKGYLSSDALIVSIYPGKSHHLVIKTNLSMVRPKHG